VKLFGVAVDTNLYAFIDAAGAVDTMELRFHSSHSDTTTTKENKKPTDERMGRVS